MVDGEVVVVLGGKKLSFPFNYIIYNYIVTNFFSSCWRGGKGEGRRVKKERKQTKQQKKKGKGGERSKKERKQTRIPKRMTSIQPYRVMMKSSRSMDKRTSFFVMRMSCPCSKEKEKGRERKKKRKGRKGGGGKEGEFCKGEKGEEKGKGKKEGMRKEGKPFCEVENEYVGGLCGRSTKTKEVMFTGEEGESERGEGNGVRERERERGKEEKNLQEGAGETITGGRGYFLKM